MEWKGCHQSNKHIKICTGGTMALFTSKHFSYIFGSYQTQGQKKRPHLAVLPKNA